MWTTVHSFILPNEAEFVQCLLETAGIQVKLRDESDALVSRSLYNVTGQIRLKVREEDIPQTQEALIKSGYLKSQENGRAARIEVIMAATDESKLTCPYCGSHKINKDWKAGFQSPIIQFTIKTFLPFLKQHYVCSDCDRNWKFQNV